MKTLPGSIFGKKIKVVHEADDVMDYVCICPHCGKEAIYGEMTMISGHSCCGACHEQLWKEIAKDKEEDYQRYITKDYEPYGVREKVKK